MIARKSGIEMPIEYFWIMKVLYDCDQESMDVEVLDEIRRRWNHMVNLLGDAGTLSEAFIRQDGSGSEESCHNYGATPAFYLSSYVLGVRTDSMGRLILEPRLGDLKFARGRVVTKFGVVEVDWSLSEAKDTLSFSGKIPEGVMPELRLPQFGKVSELIINGKKISLKRKREIQCDGRWLVKSGCTGEFSGVLVQK